MPANMEERRSEEVSHNDRLRAQLSRRPMSKYAIKPYRCKLCGFSFSRSTNLAMHMKMNHYTAKCSTCRVRMDKKLIATHSCSGSPKKKIMCSSCDFTSDKLERVRLHFMKTHDQAARNFLTKAKISQKKLKDELLERKAKTRRILYTRRSTAVPVSTNVPCWVCEETFQTSSELMDHVNIDHHPLTAPLLPGQQARDMYGLGKSAFKKGICVYHRNFDWGEVIDAQQLYRDDNALGKILFTYLFLHIYIIFISLLEVLQYELMVHKHVRMATCTSIVMILSNDTGTVLKREEFIFWMAYRPLFLSDIKNSPKVIDGFRTELSVRLDQFEETTGSGYRVEYFKNNMLSFIKGSPLTVGSGHTKNDRLFLYLKSRFASASKYLEHVSNFKEDSCFLSAVAQYFLGYEDSKARSLSARRLVSHADALKDVAEQCFNEEGVQLPMNIDKIKKFEDLNSHLDIKINIFHHDVGGAKGNLYPYRPSKKPYAKHVINLLYMTYRKGGHYVLIRNLDRLCAMVAVGPDKCLVGRVHKICPNCLQPFSGDKALEAHSRLCGKNQPQKIIMPKKGETVKFESFNKSYLSPIFGVGDFESKMIDPEPGSKADSEKSFVLKEQVPVSYSLLFVDKFGDILFQRTEAHETGL